MKLYYKLYLAMFLLLMVVYAAEENKNFSYDTDVIPLSANIYNAAEIQERENVFNNWRTFTNSAQFIREDIKKKLSPIPNNYEFYLLESSSSICTLMNHQNLFLHIEDIIQHYNYTNQRSHNIIPEVLNKIDECHSSIVHIQEEILNFSKYLKNELYLKILNDIFNYSHNLFQVITNPFYRWLIINTKYDYIIMDPDIQRYKESIIKYYDENNIIIANNYNVLRTIFNKFIQFRSFLKTKYDNNKINREVKIIDSPVIPNFIFNLKKLNKLELNSNYLMFISSEIINFKQLKVLRIVDCFWLYSLPSEIAALKLLESLVIINSGVTEIPNNLAQIKLLRINSCCINKLPNSINQLTSLKFLHIEALHLESIMNYPRAILPNLNLVEFCFRYSENYEQILKNIKTLFKEDLNVGVRTMGIYNNHVRYTVYKKII